MAELILRKAGAGDMDEINGMQVEIFHGEQKIPLTGMILAEESSPQWWVAVLDKETVGAVAAWKGGGQTHWGRFMVRPICRGMHTGTKLAQHSLEELFAQGVEEIHMEARESTVKIISKMGGEILGNPVPFYAGTVTPLVLHREDYKPR